MDESNGKFDMNEDDRDEFQGYEFDKFCFLNDEDKEKLSNFYDTDKDIFDIKEIDNFENNIKNQFFNNNEIDKNKYYHDNRIPNMEEEKKDNSRNKNQTKRDNENNIYFSCNGFFQNINPQSKLDEELPKSYECPQNNVLFKKKLISQLEENNKNNLTLKKTKRPNLHKKNKKVKNPKFTNRKRGRVSSIKANSTSNYRKIHNKFSLDNKITKVKSFIFKVLTSAFNILSDKLTKYKKHLHQICGKQAYHQKVYLDQKLMKKQLKNILNDTKDNYNKNLINEQSKNEKINMFLELKLEDIFNYLRYRIENGITGTKKILEKEKAHNFCFLEDLNLYSLYLSELGKRNNDDKKIIGDQIKEDFVKLINKRKSKEEKNIYSKKFLE